jgi:hypothetical protein
MKECSKCHKSKPLCDFYNCKRTMDGKREMCKICCSEESKKYRNKNKTILAEKYKKYRDQNKEKISISNKEQQIKRKDLILEYYKNNKERIRVMKKAYRNKNKDKISIKFKQWAEENKETYLSKRRAKNKLRLQSDPKYKLNKNFSEGIRASLVSGKEGRRWESLVGYSLIDLKNNIENKFLEGMTWENYGQWHIDHKIPISAFNYKTYTDYDFKRCWSLYNLQPLWAKDNMCKGTKLPKHFQPSLI